MKYISRKERFKHFHGPMGTVTNAINTHREIQQCRNKNTQTHTHRCKLAGTWHYTLSEWKVDTWTSRSKSDSNYQKLFGLS